MKGHALTLKQPVSGESSEELKQLLARCLRGEERAFESLYRQFAPGVYRHLKALLATDEEAEDALQQVFAHAFGKLHTFRHQSKFSTWLHGVAVHVTLNSRRSVRRRESALSALQSARAVQSGASSTGGPEDRAVSAQVAQRMSRLLEATSPENRAAFLLYYVEQLELGEVAAQLGVSSAAAWARIHRTRDVIIAALAQEEV